MGCYMLFSGRILLVRSFLPALHFLNQPGVILVTNLCIWMLWAKRLYWVLDIDIRKYFDSIPHSHLRTFLDQRVTDGVIRRMIDKWLKAGAVEDGLLSRTTEGSRKGV